MADRRAALTSYPLKYRRGQEASKYPTLSQNLHSIDSSDTSGDLEQQTLNILCVFMSM